jgi:hypothetical protein
MVCPAETPEGQAVGLVKNLSLMSHVSVGVPVSSVFEFLDEWGLDPLEHVSCRSIARTTKAPTYLPTYAAHAMFYVLCFMFYAVCGMWDVGCWMFDVVLLCCGTILC